MLSDELKASLDKIDWKNGVEPNEEPVPGFNEAMEALSHEEFMEAAVYMRDAADKAHGRIRHPVEGEELISNQSSQVYPRPAPAVVRNAAPCCETPAIPAPAVPGKG